MKKSLIVIFAAIVASGALFTSCEGNVPTNVSLKTENDTISYAFGGMLYEQGFASFLVRQNIIVDTASVRMNYQQRINAEQDEQKKSALQKEMTSKLDSANSANKKNMAEFLKGLNEAVNAPASKRAYFAGLNIGDNLSKQAEGLSEHLYGADSKEKINKDAVVAALVTSLKKDSLAFPYPSVIFNDKMERAQEIKMKNQYGDNLEAGQKFLEENKAKEGVVTLPDGLQYKIIKEGKGPKPTASDIVEVHYHGTLIDGTVFDSSVDRKKTQTFNVSNVIRGWTEILQLMPVGSKWIVYVPYDLAYGSQDRGTIKPYSALIFEVELLDIKKNETPAIIGR